MTGWIGSASGRRPRIATVLAFLAATGSGLLSSGSTAATDSPLILPENAPPAALEALGNLEIATAVALSYDGRRAALGVPDPLKPKGGMVRIYDGDPDGVTEVAIKGRVVGLAFDRSGDTVYVLGHRPGRNRVADAFLDRIDLSRLKADRLMTLPVSASDLDLWIHGSALLIACEDEIRTVTVPEGRSGQLFRVLGENLAVASLP
ncbi:MAG: hypothetical protein R3344_13760, partial [Acidobacteriota bacterium]|nr:hypothetical protein [Acidobacteriota bacterium]